MRIDYLGFGRAASGGRQQWIRDVFVFPDGTVRRRKLGRWVASHHKYEREDIADLVSGGAQVIVIGTGLFGGASATKDARQYAGWSHARLLSIPSRDVGDKVNELADSGIRGGATIHPLR